MPKMISGQHIAEVCMLLAPKILRIIYARNACLVNRTARWIHEQEHTRLSEPQYRYKQLIYAEGYVWFIHMYTSLTLVHVPSKQMTMREEWLYYAGRSNTTGAGDSGAYI